MQAFCSNQAAALAVVNILSQSGFPCRTSIVSMKKLLLLLFAALLGGAIAATAVVFYLTPTVPVAATDTALVANNNKAGAARPIPARQQLLELTDFSEAASAATPSVVFIKTFTKAASNRYRYLNQYYNQQQAERQALGTGSGVIFSTDGYIVTNNHVIDKASEIEVVINKRSYQAELVGRDPSSDLALLKIEANNLPAIELASSQQLDVGDWVLAVGNPFNLNSTVTAGIVSAKGRRINILDDAFPLESFIQTDAAINPGNSGGALVNLQGQLVGINTAILSQTGSYAGYGFAVPIDIVRKLVADLKRYGQVQKAFAGLDVTDIDENVSTRLRLSSTDGVLLSYIEPGGAAERAGLQEGDRIVSVEGQRISSRADFDEQLSYRAPGDEVVIGFVRNQRSQQVRLQLTNIEGTTGIVKREVFSVRELGASIEAVPQAESRRLNIEGGVRLSSVQPRGIISRLGLRENYIIVGVNRKAVTTPRELLTQLEQVQGRLILHFLDARGKLRYIDRYLY